MLHGFAQSPRTWDDVACGLRASGHAVYALDLAECDALCMQDACSYVVCSLRRAAEETLEAPYLVGYSLGGRVALETLVRCGEGEKSRVGRAGGACRVGEVGGTSEVDAISEQDLLAGPLPLAGLVLESAGLGPRDENQRATLAKRNEAWADDLRKRGVEAFMEWWENLPLFASQRSLPLPVRDRVRAERQSCASDLLQRELTCLGQHHQACEDVSLAALARAAAGGMPVLYVAGALDGKYVSVAKRVQDATQASVCVIPKAGHNVHLEQAQTFIGLLNRFVEPKREESEE